LFGENQLAATLLSLPIREEPPPLPAQSERAALRAAIGVLKVATDQAAAAAAPVNRLEQAVRAATAADASLKVLREEGQRQVADWIVGGCVAERPLPTVELIEAERRYALTLADAEAARSSLAPLSDVLVAANEQVRVAHHRRDEAAYLCALAIARARCTKLHARINDVLTVEAEIRSIADELTRLGNRGGDSGHVALSAAVEIRELILHTKRSAGMLPNLAAGPRLLRRLVTDATADFDTEEIHDGDSSVQSA
jgi:hypothetical protein